MKTSLLFVFIASCFLSSYAKAGILIDPYIGAASSKQVLTFDHDSLESEDDDSDGSGTVFGSRLGYSVLSFSQYSVVSSWMTQESCTLL